MPASLPVLTFGGLPPLPLPLPTIDKARRKESISNTGLSLVRLAAFPLLLDIQQHAAMSSGSPSTFQPAPSAPPPSATSPSSSTAVNSSNNTLPSPSTTSTTQQAPSSSSTSIPAATTLVSPTTATHYHTQPAASSSTVASASASPAINSEDQASWPRRGLERLSGLREFGFEVLSRRQRHERDKSSGSNSNSNRSNGPKSPDTGNSNSSRPSPPYSRSTTADGDPRPLDSSAVNAVASTSSGSALSPTPPDLPKRPPGYTGSTAAAATSATTSTSTMAASNTNSTISPPKTSPGPNSAGSTSYPSASLGSGGGGGTSSSLTALRKPTFVLVTQDHESLAKVDIAHLQSSAAIKERLYAKAHIPDDDFPLCTLHLSSLDQTDPGTALDDSEIWQICQGVVSGEITPAPLFYVNIAGGNGNASGSGTGTASSSQSSSSNHNYHHQQQQQYPGASSPEFLHSPYNAPGTSPFGIQDYNNSNTNSNKRPESRHDTSSNSSAGVRPNSHPHYSRSNTQQQASDMPLASPMRSDQPQPNTSPSFPPPSSFSNTSPHPPYAAFMDHTRRSSTGAAEKVISNTSEFDHQWQQHQHQSQQQHNNNNWERRSSAGTSDYSDRPDWLEKPGHLRRQDRQSRSESAARHFDFRDPSHQIASTSNVQFPSSHQGLQGQQQQQQQQQRRPPVTVQQVGMGPSGPIYRSVAAQSSRPRANSATNNIDPGQAGRYGPGVAQGPGPQSMQASKQASTSTSSRGQPAQSFGPSGPLHFPQPMQYDASGNVINSSSSRRPHANTGPDGHQSNHLMPGPSRNNSALNAARSMGDLRGNGASSAPPPARGRATGAGAGSGSGSGGPGALLTSNNMSAQAPNSGGQRSPYAPPPTLYEDGRYAPQMRPSGSDAGRPMSQMIVSPRSPYNQQLGPPVHPQARMPPTNTSPRIPSYPPAVQRLPPAQPVPQGIQAQRTGTPLQRGYPPSQGPYRRPSFEQLQRPNVPSALVSGPQRIPLHPGETLQEVLHGQHQQQQQQQHQSNMSRRMQEGGPVPSPRHAQTAFDQPAGNAYVHPGHNARAYSYEERPRSAFGLHEVHHRQQYQGPPVARPQYVEQASFTASPPLQERDDAGFVPSQPADQHTQPASSSGGTRRAPSPAQRTQYFEVHSSSNGRSNEPYPDAPRSPSSSRPSTSSDGPSNDKDAQRPHSYSSSSTNELSTPSSDRQNDKSGRNRSKDQSPSHSKRQDISPHVVDEDEVYEGVEMLRESIDAVTLEASDKNQQQYDTRQATTSKAPILDPIEEGSDTIQASEWADLFVRMGSKDGNDGDTIGKSKNRLSGERSDEESSTLGKTQRPPAIAIEGQKDLGDNVKDSTQAATSHFVMPAPAVAYNPDDDDDDDVMTWAVQMKPTKPATVGEDKPETKAETSTLEKGRSNAPKHVNLPSGGVQDVVDPSPRLERPNLKLQTDKLGPNGTPPSRPSALPGNGTSSSLPATKPANTLHSAVSGSGKPSASPRSASRKARQASKDNFNNDSPASAHPNPSPRNRNTPVSALDGANADTDGEGDSISVMRRRSFGNNVWAYRPPVEQVYENLEEFFPGHDLDKPIVDAGASGSNSAVSSPAQESIPFISPTQARAPEIDRPIPSPAPKWSDELPVTRKEKDQNKEQEGGRRFNQNRKSMRMVAQDRKLRMRREENLTKATTIDTNAKDAQKLARRKSTKVWGRKIEEVTAAEADLLHSARTEASDRDELAPIKWVKGELIGKGTYGHVYIGFNVTNGEMIAVKQVELPRTASDKEDNRQLSVIEALKSEMELLKDLEHEKIVSYLGFEESPTHLSILLEYVPGGSVGRCLRKHGKFEVQVIQFFTTQILEGLEYLHSRGILHRDLKADNILVKMDGTIKISDFGISKRSNDIYNNNSNMSMQGSIFWMAPEVVHNSRKGYSAKIDIWSLGCVVLEMFAGRRPWDSEEAIQAMFKLGAERLAPPVPKDVVLTNQSNHFLKECFQGEPSRRPTASRLLCHKFLTLDKDWDFRTSSLAKAMSA